MNKAMFGKLVKFITDCLGFLSGSVVKNPLAKEETWVQSLGWEDPLEKEIPTHSSILVCEILWTEEPGRLQSLRSQRVGHNGAIEHSDTPPVMSERSVGRKKKL